MSEPHVVIHTDGACSGNPGPGGWGAILAFGAHTKELKGGEPHTTNNRMELMAAIAALEALKKPVKNVDLWQRLDGIAARHQIRWHWLKGHAGHRLNERADQLARDAISAILSGAVGALTQGRVRAERSAASKYAPDRS